MSSQDDHRINNVALVSEHRGRIRDLSGYRRTFTVPTEHNDRTQSFVGRICYQEISEDLDCRFAEFRRHFGFTRLELQVSEPDNGCGVIQTPYFEYRVTMLHAEDDPAETILRHQVTEFRDSESVLSPEFAAVFGVQFNTVDYLPSSPIDVEAFIDRLEQQGGDSASIDYDRSGTWCEVTLSGIAGSLLVTPERISLSTRQPDLPAHLLTAFFQFKERLTGID